MRIIRCLSTFAIVTLVCPFGAVAVDGVNEINQTSITAAGGFPYTIPTAGSYVLTSNLAPPGATGALVVGAANVEIDLNGFAITSTGGGGAIGISSAGFSGFVARNGTVEGFGGAAIAAATGSKVIEMNLTGNGAGITGGSDCLIVMNTIGANAGTGVNANNCKIENNMITGNSGAGIVGGSNVIVHNRIGSNSGGGITGMAGTVQENVIFSNTSHGISDGAPPGVAPVPPPFGPGRMDIRGNTISETLPGAPVGGRGVSFLVPVLVTENTISGNAGLGVFCGGGCVVNGNSINTNGVGVPGTGGVTVAAGSTVSSNSISYNTGFGLTIPVTAGYTNNTITGNTAVGVVVPPPGPPTVTGGFGNNCGGAVCP